MGVPTAGAVFVMAGALKLLIMCFPYSGGCRLAWSGGVGEWSGVGCGVQGGAWCLMFQELCLGYLSLFYLEQFIPNSCFTCRACNLHVPRGPRLRTSNSSSYFLFRFCFCVVLLPLQRWPL